MQALPCSLHAAPPLEKSLPDLIPEVGKTYIGPSGVRCTILAAEADWLLVRAGKGTIRFPRRDASKWLRPEE